jgi:hypothetical protein
VTASNGWRASELSAIDGCGEVDIAPRRTDGTLRPARNVWIVRHSSALYVRSVNGATAAWYRGARTCHEGELSAGRLHRGVVFVEAGTHAGEGSGLDDAWMPPIAASTAAHLAPSPASWRMSPVRQPCASNPPNLFAPAHLNDDKDATWTRTLVARR